MALQLPFMLSPGMIQAGRPAPLRLFEEHVARPIVVTGGSGGGKTKFLEQFIRQLIDQGTGFTYIDPHGDGCEALLPYLALSKIDPERVHYLKPSPKGCFRLDPFADIPTDLTPIAYASRLKATVDRIIRAFLRNLSAADQEIVKRMRRCLRTVLLACGVRVDGRHLGIAKARIFLNPRRPEFAEAMTRIGPALRAVDADAYYDLVELQETRSDTLRDKWTESTKNCLADILYSNVVSMMFGQHAPASVSMKEVILTSGFQFVNLRRTDDLSREAAKSTGGLILTMLLAAAENLAESMPYEKRVPHYVIVDEAENFIGEDVRMSFAEHRKFRMPMCLAFQDINCLVKGDLDLLSKAFGNAGLVCSFPQQDVESLEYLSKVFAYGSLDFSQLIEKRVLPGGYVVVPNMTVTLSAQEGISRSEAESLTLTHSKTHQHHTSESIQQGISRALSRSETEGESETYTDGHSDGTNLTDSWTDSTTRSSQRTRSTNIAEGEGHATSEGTSESETSGTTRNTSHSQGATSTHQNGSSGSSSVGHVSGSHSSTQSTANGSGESHNRGTTTTKNVSASRTRTMTQGESVGEGEAMTHGRGGSVGRSHTENHSHAIGRSSSRTTGITDSTTVGIGHTRGESAGSSEGHSQGLTSQQAVSQGNGVSIAYGSTPLAVQRIEEYEAGLRTPVNDQIAEVMNRLAAMPDRFVLVKCKGLGIPFILKTHEVVDPYKLRGLGYLTPEWRADDVRRFLERVWAAHRYYFVPEEVLKEEPEERDWIDDLLIVRRNGTNGHAKSVLINAGDPME